MRTGVLAAVLCWAGLLANGANEVIGTRDGVVIAPNRTITFPRKVILEEAQANSLSTSGYSFPRTLGTPGQALAVSEDGLSLIFKAADSAGDMLKSVYDADNDLTADDAEALGGVLAADYATQTWVADQIAAIPPIDLSSYATQDWVDAAIAAIPPPNLAGYATETFVDETVAAIPLHDPVTSSDSYIDVAAGQILSLDLPALDAGGVAMDSEVAGAIAAAHVAFSVAPGTIGDLVGQEYSLQASDITAITDLLYAASSHAHAAGDITSGTIDMLRLPAGLATDQEVTDAIAAIPPVDLSDYVTSGELATEIGLIPLGDYALLGHVHDASEISSGTFDMLQMPAALATDDELATAIGGISTHDPVTLGVTSIGSIVDQVLTISGSDITGALAGATITGTLTATDFIVGGSSVLTEASSLDASKLTGALPALDGSALTGVVADISAAALLTGANQPFTGNLNVSLANPRLTLTDSATDSPTVYLEKLATLDGAQLVSQNRPFVAGNGLTLNGSGFASRASVSLGQTYSIEFWLKTSSTTDAQFIGCSGFVYPLGSTSNMTGIYARNDVGQFASWTGLTIADGQWHHWVLTRTGVSYVLYKDGVSQGARTGSGGSADANYTHVGSDGSGTSRLTGQLDQVVIWNKVLDQTEVTARYNSGAGAQLSTYSNVVAEYRLNSDYVDSSPNARNLSAGGSGNSFATGAVSAGTQPLEDIPVFRITNSLATNQSYGDLRVGYYSGTKGTANAYEGLSHTFSILGTRTANLSSSLMAVTGAVTASTTITSGGLRLGSPSASTQQTVSLENTDSAANSSIVVSPKGTGAFIFGVRPDNGTAGGAARGTYAFDAQGGRAAAARVASGSYSFVAGYGNLASGTYNAAIGYNNQSSASAYAVSLGVNNIASGSNASLGSVAIGGSCQSTQWSTYTFGEICVASAARSMAIGGSATADDLYSVVVGTWAAVSSDRQNQFKVRAAGGITHQNDVGTMTFWGKLSSAPSTGVNAGDIYYNTTDNRHYGYNGTTWNAFY